MKTGVPWQLKGARPHVREAAREAARRAGMSVSEWLDTVITDSADNDVIEPARRLRANEDDDRHDDFEDVTRYQDSESGPRQRRGKYADYDERHRRTRDEDLAAVTERLDTLSRLLEERQFQERQLQEQMLQEQRLQERPLQERQPQVPGPDMAAVNERLDALSRQLAEVAQATQAAQATQLAYAAQLAPAQTPLAPSPRPDDTPHQLASVISKLDRRLDQLIADGRSASAEIEKRMSAVDRAVAQIDREPQRPAVPEPATPLDQALVEIAERQRALDGEAGLPRSDLPRAPTQGLNGLEQQLRQITTQIESLRPCNVNGVVETLRDDLAEIGVMVKEAMPRRAMETLESEVRSLVQRIDSKRHTGGEASDLAGVERGLVQVRDSLRDDLAEIGVMLKEAMPRRAIETLETEVRSLAQRIDTKRHAGADGPDIAGVERGLAEVRDALRALTPAENLVGYDEAVRSLSKKIDGIAASTQDPAALEQLEGAIAGLRGIVSHVASNDAIATLSEEVRSLARKVEQVASSDVVAMLEQRIGAIADALQARPHTGQDARDLDAVVHGLTEKLEQLQLTRSDQVAVNHLEDRIVNLVQKLDASDARLSHLETIERGLAELLIHLEHQRLPQLGRSDAAPPPEVDTLKRDFQKTQDSLEAVHGALGHVVDRLAMIETGLRSEAAPSLPKASNIARIPAPPPPAPPVSPPAPPKAPAPLAVAVAAPPIAEPAPAPIAAPPQQQQPQQPAPAAIIGNPAPASERGPIDPNLPPDHPLEPGRGTRARAGNSPADRIAASEAALGSAKPPVIPDPAGKSNFIAAARRAAQAATGESAVYTEKREGAPAAPATAGGSSRTPAGAPASSLGTRVRKLLVGASVVAIVLGSLQLAASLFIGGSDNDPHVAAEPNPSSPETKTLPPAPTGPIELPAAPPAPPAPSPAPPAGRQSQLLPFANGVAFAPPSAGVLMPSEPARPAASAAAPTDRTIVTGSIRPPSAAPAAVPAETPSLPSTPAKPIAADKLPAAVGSGGLRAAAAKGDAGAEYEIAARFSEGRGVPQDGTAAVEWFERAAKQGLVPAQFRLGGLYEKGIGVAKDPAQARRLYTAAAQSGHAKAMHNLAVLYAEGVDGKPDYQTAAKWFRKAADHGVTDSQYNLAILYARGIGTEVNLAEAYKWFSLAARDGDKDSAKKRDDVGTRLDPQTLMAARAAVQVWAAEPQPEAATSVKAPAGGWDGVPAPSVAKRRVGPEPKTETKSAPARPQ